MLEFSLAISSILLVLFGIIDLGRALYAYDWVSDAARRSTRFAMVRGEDCRSLAGGCPATSSDVTTYVRSLATGIDTGQLTVTTTCFATASVSSPPPCAPPGWVNVNVQYNFYFVSPLFPLHWTMHSDSQRLVQQ